MSDKTKDRWDKADVCARIAFAAASLLFAGIFGFMQRRNEAATQQLAASNFELSKSETKISLLPLLCSEDARQRMMALSLTRTLDNAFAVEVASILAISDPQKEVRQSARSVLSSLSRSKKEEVKASAQRGVERFETMGELRMKGLLQTLEDAQGYLDGGAANGDAEAVRRYRQVLASLSPEALAGLDQDILKEAQSADSQGRLDQAARLYSSLFSDFRRMEFDST